MVKKWLISNIGLTDLEYEYHLVQVEGPPLVTYGPEALAYTIFEGDTSTVSIQVFTPFETGHYNTYWQFEDSHGNRFGDLLPFEFEVVDTPVPTTDNATFVADVTIPDGTTVIAGAALGKTWRMRNSGASTWDGYQLVFVSGNQMGAPNAVAVPHTAPGQTADISVNLTAPNSDGEYTGYWRLRNPQGTFFGPTIWVKINVGTASSYISVLTTDPPSPADTNQVTIHARADNFPNFRAMRLKIDGDVVYELGAPEFYYNWQTANYAPGEHSILVEVANWTDLSWNHPETRSMTYVLTGNGAPTNHAPYPPTLTSPADWHVYYSGNTAQLCAQDTGDPDGDPISQYQFDIFESAQLWNSGWVNNNCVTTGALGPYSYQWRVKVRDGQGAESGWSDSRHFTLVNPNLTITELYFEPQDGNSEAVKIRACTDGQGGVGITMRVSVNDAADGSGNGEWHILKELGVPCFNADDAPIWFTLPYGDGPHRVRVEAHGSSTGWDGAAIREEVYTLSYRRPPGNDQVAPRPVSGNIQEAVYLNSRTISFRWEPALRATSQTLHVSTNPSPKDDPNPVFRQSFASSVTEHQITFSQDYPTLYWQVEAINNAGASASGDQRFGIDRAAPACNIGTLPDTTFENVFQVSWATSDGLSGVNTADIQYQDSREGEWRNWLIDTPAAKTYDLFYGEAGHGYQFRCRATDNANNRSAYSSASTQIQVDPTARPSEPWWDAAYAQKRAILALNNMPARNIPVGYPIHIHFDATTTPTAAEIYNGSLSPVKCNDLRVVYDNSIELNRHIASCQSDSIDIWFPSQTVINPGATDDTSYRLYYANALASNPPADQTVIWPPLVDANTVGLWYFSEGTGSTTVDHSGNGNNGNTGILTWVDGKFGNALSSPYAGPGPNGVFVPGNSSLGSPVFTLEFFAKRYTMHPEGYIAGMGMSGNGRERMRLMIESPGRIKFQIDPEPGGASDIWAQSGCLADLEWHHVAVTFDGDRSGSIYCDGVLAGSGLFNESGISNLNYDLHLGSDFSVGTRFNGAIDQVRLSNIVRTSFPYAEMALVTNEPTIAVGDAITPPTGNQPDLAVISLRSYPNPEGGILVEAVLKNEGNVPTQNGFFTDLYWDNRPTGPGVYTDSLHFWVNSPIQAGDIVTVTTVIDDISLLPTRGTNNLEALQELNGMMYVQVDSTGAVGEANNTNNISTEGTQVCIASADVYEGDNSWQEATLSTWDSSQRHNIHTLNDEDWFAIQVTANQTYTIKTINLASSADTYLYLYDTDGTTLLTSNDDYNGTLASQIEWYAPTTGTYYVQAKHWNPNVGGCNTGYTVLFGQTKLFLPVIARP
ncbi:MAG: pre-peptidase C-terminal domain-containing protein [Anaerolineae bacterium]|nr:pre-peptidase C-terminal domain-containing protein [Anaerolineae bacterium]